MADLVNSETAMTAKRAHSQALVKGQSRHNSRVQGGSTRSERLLEVGQHLGALKKLVVPGGLEKHEELVAACRAKGVELE